MYRDVDDAWMEDAACAEVGDGWFPEKGESARPAKEICRGCSVIQDCLEYALRNDHEWGIWGGKTDKERKDIQRQRARRQPMAGAA